MKYFILTLSIILLVVGCAKTTKEAEVIATLNNHKITMGMLDERISELPEYYQQAASQHKRELLEDLIVEQLLFDEAKKRQIDKDKEVKDLIRKATRKITVAKLLEIETTPRKTVSDEDIELYYQQHKEQYLVPERVKASHILVNTEEEANKILASLHAGADFAELAKLHSKDLTKERGGDLGYFQRGQMIPEFENACFALNPGEISGVIQTRFGYHIVKVTDKLPAEYKTLSEVRENIRAKLIEQTQQDQFKDFVETLKKKAKIKVKEEAFKQNQPEAPADTEASSGDQ
ncbi:MAG: peptidylprolyl isomerase [Candidatus Omnitrophica bacterium]|nr:peptidylprolyl isomerase [Candidatus Omnitrophota bacterium]